MYADLGDARKLTTAATSSAMPHRRSGMRSRNELHTDSLTGGCHVGFDEVGANPLRRSFVRERLGETDAPALDAE